MPILYVYAKKKKKKNGEEVLEVCDAANNAS